MRRNTLTRLILPATAALWPQLARATDQRYDVATYNHTADDTAWFGDGQMPYLNFPSANGHSIAQGGSTHLAALQSQGNTLSVYYDTFHSLYSSTETPAAAVATIQGWIKSQFGSYETGACLVLNEVDGSTWNSSSGSAYRTWLVNTMSALNSAGYKNIILYAENSLASKSTASTWQSIAQYANIGDECYIDGPTAVADNFSVSKLQSVYQASYDAWTNTSSGAGVPAAKVFLGEHFSVNQYASSNYWGADGVSGTQWEQTIEARDLAIHNIGFGGFIGYAWDKDAQATGNPTTDLANQIAYEKAYASTLVVQSEIPAWTGNDDSTSWADYLNWTGGLPSMTSAPYPLLASTNPNLPKQTAANFLNAIKADTTITLDGNQSITNLSFAGPYSYTIAPGTGGTLTITGSGASIAVASGSHSISAGLIIDNNIAADIDGNLNVSSDVTNSGYALIKSGNGALTISGPQHNAPNASISISAGSLILNSDAGSSTAASLSLSGSAGTITLNSSQHLASLSLTGANAAMRTTGKSLFVHAINVSNNSQLDLTQNDLIVDYTGNSPLSAIQADISSGYNNGAWNGPGIITTGAPPRPAMGLGCAEASDILNLSGAATATFDGETVDNSTVLVKYTLLGDANLDGRINGDDYFAIDSHVNVPGASGYANGDFNYDGKINGDDYFIIDSNINQQSLNMPGASPSFATSSASTGVSFVPEPASIALLSLAALATCSRRRRRRA